MDLAFGRADEKSVRAFLNWRYDPPYDIYNPDPGPDQVEQDVRYFLNPRNACYCGIGPGGDLLVYCTFGPDGQVPGGDYRAEALDIGLGVRPDLTGQGRGLEFVKAVLDFGRHTFKPVAFRVTIAAFNKRALKVWEQSGFRRVQTFQRARDGRPFVVLMRDA